MLSGVETVFFYSEWGALATMPKGELPWYGFEMEDSHTNKQKPNKNRDHCRGFHKFAVKDKSHYTYV